MRNFFQKAKDDVSRIGLLGAAKNAVIRLHRYKILSRKDFVHSLLCLVLRPKNAYKLVFSIFKFRCDWNLFFLAEKRLELGVCLNKYVIKTVYVNPKDIKYVIKGGNVPYIQSGDWDLQKKDFEIHPTIKELFVDNLDIPIDETYQYKLMIGRIKKGLATYWCKTEQDVKLYFKEMLHMCHEIKSGNYKSQSAIDDSLKKSGKSRYPNEVLLSIDRDGNYMHEKGGSHRLSMAKISNIDKIPAVIIRYHYDYLKKNGKI